MAGRPPGIWTWLRNSRVMCWQSKLIDQEVYAIPLPVHAYVGMRSYVHDPPRCATARVQYIHVLQVDTSPCLLEICHLNSREERRAEIIWRETGIGCGKDGLEFDMAMGRAGEDMTVSGIHIIMILSSNGLLRQLFLYGLTAPSVLSKASNSAISHIQTKCNNQYQSVNVM